LPDLLDRLVQAQAENRMRKKMAHLRKCRLPVLDELDYRSLDRQATACLFQLISERYERGSMILTSNKIYGEWGSISQEQRDRQRDSRSSVAAPLAHRQHQGRKLPAKGETQSGVWTQPAVEPVSSGGGA
jgi:DNA replication protein DnaC